MSVWSNFIAILTQGEKVSTYHQTVKLQGVERGCAIQICIWNQIYYFYFRLIFFSIYLIWNTD